MVPLERLIRVLLRAHPPRFRSRFGAEVERAAREDIGPRPRGLAAVFVIADLVATLGRAWARELAVAAGRALRGSAGAARGALGDARLAVRGLAREPLQGFVVVATLALAIGANASVFAATHALLLRTLPYDAPERVVLIDTRGVELEDTAEPHPMLDAVSVYFPRGGANLFEGEEATRVRLTQVSPSFFRVLGVELLLSPGLPGDQDAEPVVVLSHPFWTEAYGRDRGIVGEAIELNGRGFRIAGVAPPGVDFPAGTQLWLSEPVIPEFYGGPALWSTLGRMAPGVSAPQLEADLGRRRQAERMDASDLPTLRPLREDLTGPVRLPLLVLTGAAALVLLLGCLNVAGVSLAQLWARGDELAVRTALGAGRARLVRQLVAESAAVAALGGAASLALAWAGVPVLRALLPAETPGLAGVQPGSAAVLAAFVATLSAGLLTGFLPALVVARRPTAPGGFRATRSRSSTRLHAGLVVTQLALAVVLVTGAAMLGESLRRLHRVPMGFHLGVLTFEVSLPRSGFPDPVSWDAYRTDLTRTVAAVPGVSFVGSTSRLPLSEHTWVGWWIGAYDRPEQQPRITGALLVSADYFAAMGVPVVEGRTFSAFPTGAEREIILSQSLALELFPQRSAVGERVLIHRGDDPASSLVVGVVGDVRGRGPAQEAGDPALFYERLDARSAGSTIGFAVRAEGDPSSLAAAVREAAARVHPSVPVFRMRTTGEAVATTLAAQRALGVLSALFGAGAALLSTLGIYGVVAQGVARRRRELGIRLALGAEAGDLVRTTLASGARLAVLGVVAGVAASLYATRLLKGLLFGTDTADARTFAAAVAGLGLVTLIASYLPARRAARADPLESLRSE